MKKIILLLLVHILAYTAYAQNVRTITGRITDSKTNEPMIGATVFISPDEKGVANYSPQGVVTDYDGNFLFTLPTSVKTIVVSYVGYTAQNVILTTSGTYNIALNEDAMLLNDVVVTGYQRIERRKLTSSVARVEADDIKQVGAPNIDQLLSGQVAGLVSTPTTGAPGAASKIRIRGTVSLSGSSDPLWVLDGIPLEGNDIPKDILDSDNIDNLSNVSIAGLNPNDIKDITILKDAAATAIYGARAANGVIVITTKRGREGKLRINFTSDLFYTFKPQSERLNLMNASQKVDFELALAQNPMHNYRSENGEVARILKETNQLDILKKDGFSKISPEAQQKINTLRNQGFNWFDEVYRGTFNQQYGLSLSGGGNIANYYFSTGYYTEQGTTKGTSFDRFNITLNTDFNITSKLKFNVSLFANQNNRNSYVVNGVYTNPQNYTRNVNPYFEAFDKDGKYRYDPDLMNTSDLPIPFNYIEEQKNTSYFLKAQSLKSIFEINYDLLKSLKLLSQVGLQVENNASEKYGAAESFFTRQYRESNRYRGKSVLPEGGIIQNWDDRFFQYNWRNQLFFQKRFNERHDIDVMLGMEMRRNNYTEIQTKGFGFDPNSMTTKPIVFPQGFNGVHSASFRQYAKRYIENAFLSYFATASYTLNDKYTLFGSLRYDGSNLFGVDPKYRYLPLWSISGAWNAGREEFLKNIPWLSNLKVRASYGLQGNIDKETSPFVKGVWTTTGFFSGQDIPVISVTSPPNKYLRWEKTSTSNMGFDLGLFDNRVNLSFDTYYRYSQDLINSKAIPLENGFNFVNLNWAEVSNKGWEVSLSTLNVKTKSFRWYTDFNIAKNVSKVHRINTSNNDWFPSREGYPVNAVFGIKTAGLDENGIMQFKNSEGKTVSMQEFYNLQTNMWGDVSSSYSAMEFRKLFTYMGDMNPELTGGFINRFNYKNFDLSISTSFFLNRTIRATPFYYPTRIDPGLNYTTAVQQIWNADDERKGAYPRILGRNLSDPDLSMAFSWLDSYDASRSYDYYDIWMKKQSYMRVNSIRLGYTLGQDVLKSNYISSIRLSMEARNPFVLGTEYNGYFDPESYGNIYAQPIPKTISFGVNVTF
ncbi:MAG: SusC/RagA family TonB-linked outer membrane protein [Petrimonas sp.]|uniref:SusC/RagA family TonB-linked outer membrane protein n=1 Tax=Petrimonas sp. TaxID=2023866 RepID=UPI002B3BA1E8|nr:SusC/RagA family TonB-linked outer membrane protein [Petrimonas sp.]